MQCNTPLSSSIQFEFYCRCSLAWAGLILQHSIFSLRNSICYTLNWRDLDMQLRIEFAASVKLFSIWDTVVDAYHAWHARNSIPDMTRHDTTRNDTDRFALHISVGVRGAGHQIRAYASWRRMDTWLESKDTACKSPYRILMQTARVRQFQN